MGGGRVIFAPAFILIYILSCVHVQYLCSSPYRWLDADFFSSVLSCLVVLVGLVWFGFA